jgi:hypothetical protein
LDLGGLQQQRLARCHRKQLYSLHEYKKWDVVRNVRKNHFDKYSHVTSLEAKDMLLYKGLTELTETLNLWKTPPHVGDYCEPQGKPLVNSKLLHPESTTPQTAFLNDFFLGPTPIAH